MPLGAMVRWLVVALALAALGADLISAIDFGREVVLEREATSGEEEPGAEREGLEDDPAITHDALGIGAMSTGATKLLSSATSARRDGFRDELLRPPRA